MRHGTCFHRRLSAHHAGAAPHSAVAELEVVRRRYRPVKSKTNVIVNRIGLVLFVLGIGGCYAWHDYHRGFPWFQGVGIALIIIGSIMGNMTIHDSEPSAWKSFDSGRRDAWFSQSIQSLAAQHPIVTRLMLVNLLVREMNLTLSEANSLVDDYCRRKSPEMLLHD